MLRAYALFILAGLAEIGGGYLVWQWLRQGKPVWMGVLGGFVLGHRHTAGVRRLRQSVRRLRRGFYRPSGPLGMGD